MHELKPPNNEIGEFLEKTLKGLASLIPGIGGMIAEYMDYYLPNSLGKRRDEFLKDVAYRLNELNEKNLISIESLKSNELFTSIIYSAIKESMNIHQKEKRDYLKNAVINTALKIDINHELQQRFIFVVSQLTATHIQLLSSFRNIEINTIDSYDGLFTLCKEDFHGDRDEFKMFCQDLLSHGLINISTDFSDFEDVAHSTKIIAHKSQSDAPYVRVTSVGNSFLQYVSSTD